MKPELDLVIIGAAAAGCAAAVYAARRHLNFVVVSKDIGGEVALSGEVENWPGTQHTTGIELAKTFHEHALSYGVQFDEGVGVTKLEQVDNYHIVHAQDAAGNEKTYTTKAIIIATGIHPRELGIEGEKELKGRGVTYCTVCDGPLFGGKVTATIGAGNSAVESALMMGEIAEKVYIVTKYPNTPETKGGFPKAEDILVKKMKELKNLEVIYNADTTKILGDGLVSGIAYKDNDSREEKELELNGVMVHIGVIPNSDFVDCVNKSDVGEIEVDLACRTNCDGVFAAGDVTTVPYNQIAIAAGQGVTAALTAIDYINRWKEK